MDKERYLPQDGDESRADELLRPFREIYTEQYLNAKIGEHEDQLAAGEIEDCFSSGPDDWLELWLEDLERLADRTHMWPDLREAFGLTLLGCTQEFIAENMGVSQGTVSRWLTSAWGIVRDAALKDRYFGLRWVYYMETHRE